MSGTAEPHRTSESPNILGPSSPRRKIVPLELLLQLRAQARAGGRRVALCHGCFDIVHPGHIRHLRQARAAADVLVVSITADAQIAKGTGRPLIPEELRAENLAELDCVDFVCIEREATALSLLERLAPDVYVKGREYEHNDDPRFLAERAAVERLGGQVLFTSGDVVFSSTALVSAIERSTDPYHARITQLLSTAGLGPDDLGALLAGFHGKQVLVVGEMIRDTYVLCDQPEVASESPVMTLRPLEKREYDGGAAIIARHLAALGARPTLVTCLPAGTDPRGEAVARSLAAEGVEVVAVHAGPSLIEKQRFLVNAQKVMKLNLGGPLVLDARTQDRLVELCAGAAEHKDAAIVADFGLGLLSAGTLDRVCPLLRGRVGVLAGDVSGRRSNLRRLRGFDLLCPSEAEVREAYRAFDEGIATTAWRLLEETGSRAALVTMGAEGLVAFEPHADAPAMMSLAGQLPSRVRAEHVPALTPHAIDPLGCGDAMLAVATLSLCVRPAWRGGLLPAAFLASIAAAEEALRLGNVPIAAADIRRRVRTLHESHLVYCHPDARSFPMTGGGTGGRGAHRPDSTAPSFPARAAM